MGFISPVFSCIRVESAIISLDVKIIFREGLYSSIFYARPCQTESTESWNQRISTLLINPGKWLKETIFTYLAKNRLCPNGRRVIFNLFIVFLKDDEEGKYDMKFIWGWVLKEVSVGELSAQKTVRDFESIPCCYGNCQCFL